MLLVPRGCSSRQGGKELRAGSGVQEKAVGRLLWKQQHQRSQQTSGIWSRVLLTKKALKTLLGVISSPKEP